MNHARLGRTGLQVSRLCLGTTASSWPRSASPRPARRLSTPATPASTSYNPIAGGLLSGKHSRTAPPPEGTRFTLGNAAQPYQDRYWHDREFDTVDALRQIAGYAGVSLVTLAVAWVQRGAASLSDNNGAVPGIPRWRFRG